MGETFLKLKMADWRAQEERKKKEAAERAEAEAAAKAAALADLKKEREDDPSEPRPEFELRADRNQGSSGQFGGGGESSWKKQDEAIKGLDSLDSMFNEVLK